MGVNTQLAGLAPFLQNNGFLDQAQNAAGGGAPAAQPLSFAQTQQQQGITPTPTSQAGTGAGTNAIMSLIQQLFTGSSFGAGGDTAI